MEGTNCVGRTLKENKYHVDPQRNNIEMTEEIKMLDGRV